jgi:transcriptional regulator with XRE-family HTH domain
MNIRDEWVLFRKSSKLTQKQVAQKVGVSISMISRYEHNQRNLTPENEQKLLQIMKEAGEIE